MADSCANLLVHSLPHQTVATLTALTTLTMPDLNGADTMWAEFPDWQATYGFAMRRSPCTGTSLHVDHSTSGPACAVARFQVESESPTPTTATVQNAAPVQSPTAPKSRSGRWTQLFRRRPPPQPPKTQQVSVARFVPRPIHFTSFFWYDGSGKTHECTREELCLAFRRLVADWQELFSLGCAVYSAWEEPFLDSATMEPLPEDCEEVLARENELFRRIKSPAKQWHVLGLQMFWEAELFAQHLSFLCELEDSGQLPGAFMSYPHKFGQDFGDYFTERVRLLRRGNRVDNWALCLANIVNRRAESDWPRVSRVAAMRTILQQLGKDILVAKGHTDEKEFEQHHAAVIGTRHRMPPQEEYVSSAQLQRGVFTDCNRIKAWRIYSKLVPVHDLRESEKRWKYDPAYSSAKNEGSCKCTAHCPAERRENADVSSPPPNGKKDDMAPPSYTHATGALSD